MRGYEEGMRVLESIEKGRDNPESITHGLYTCELGRVFPIAGIPVEPLKLRIVVVLLDLVVSIAQNIGNLSPRVAAQLRLLLRMAGRRRKLSARKQNCKNGSSTSASHS